MIITSFGGVVIGSRVYGEGEARVNAPDAMDRS